LPYIDTLFADFKIYDTKEHKKHTGVENKLITSNLELILRSEHKDKIIVRTPLIPNITATRDNIHNISKFISDIYPNVKYEILNYNPLAKSKYDLIDELEYCFDNNPSMYSNEEMEMFYQIAYSAGIKNLIIQ